MVRLARWSLYQGDLKGVVSKNQNGPAEKWSFRQGDQIIKVVTFQGSTVPLSNNPGTNRGILG